jgi:hypothetical protein
MPIYKDSFSSIGTALRSGCGCARVAIAQYSFPAHR